MCKTITIKCDCSECNEQAKSLIIPQGNELIFKTAIDGNNEELETGDYVIKNINGAIVSGFFQGPDKDDANNYN